MEGTLNSYGLLMRSAEAAGAQAAAADGSDVDDLVPLTPAQKVGVGLNLGAWAAGLSLAAVCGYYIVRELLPTKMSPNSVFDRAFAVVVADERVQRIYGDPLKGYGRDHGGHREGRHPAAPPLAQLRDAAALAPERSACASCARGGSAARSRRRP